MLDKNCDLDEIYDWDEIYGLDEIYDWDEIYVLDKINGLDKIYGLDEIYLLGPCTVRPIQFSIFLNNGIGKYYSTKLFVFIFSWPRKMLN